MKKSIYFIAILTYLLCFFSSSAFAQNLIKGTITDESGGPLMNVHVQIIQNKMGTTTDSEGNYQLSAPSNLKIISIGISYVGYSTDLQTIDLSELSDNEDYILNISLKESVLELKEVTLTAGFIKEQDAVSYPIESVKSEAIINSGGVNLSQAISRTPGVYFSSFGNGASKPIIRGLSNTNIVLLNNGIKQEAFQFSSNHPFLIDEFTASHVEIIKGPASLQYGSDAVGGVVNVVRELPAIRNRLEGDFVSQYSTNTNGVVNSLGIKGSYGDLFLGVRGSIKSHKDFSDGLNNTVNNSRFNENNLSVNGGIRKGYGIFSVNYNYTEANYGIQNRGTLNLFSNPLASSLLNEKRENEVWYQDLGNHLISSNNTIFLGKNTLDLDLGYQANKRELVGGAINDEDQIAKPVLASMQLNTFTYNLKLNIPSGDSKLLIGLNGARIDNEADESKPNVPMLDAKINDVALYTIGDFALSDQLTLTSGLRYDFRAMESFPIATANTNRFKIDNNYHNLNGSFGVTYNFKESQYLKVNLARGYRSPTLPELTQNGLHAGRYERGNPDLNSQSNYQVDLTYHLHTSMATINIAPFFNFVNDYVYVVMTNEDAPIGDGKVFQHVQNDANLWGGELALDIHPANWLGIHGSYSMVRANITSDDEGIEHPTYTPQDRLTGEIKLQQKKIKFLNNSFASVELIHFFEQNRTGQNEASTPSYTLLNTRLQTSTAINNRTLDLFAVGSNLTNTTYIDHLSVNKQLGLNMIGRNIMFGIRLPIGT